jgi:hypothetical protein
MPLKLSGRAIAASLCAAVACTALAADAGKPYYPEGYAAWTVAKFKLIGPEHPNYESQGGFRHHFANDIALASWGKFADGAVIVDERVHARLDGRKVWSAGDLAHVAVMRKDAAQHPDTGGWYFNLFTGADATGNRQGMTPARAKAACFDACHRAQAARDFVFSDPRR